MSPTRRPALAALALGLLMSSTLVDRAGAEDTPSPPISDPSTTTSALETSTSAPGSSEAPPETTPVVQTTFPGVVREAADPGATSTTTAASSSSISDTTAVAPPPSDGVVEGVTESVPIVAPALVDLPTRGSRPGRVVAGVSTRVNALIRAAKDANHAMLDKLGEAEARNRTTALGVASAQARMDRLSAKERVALRELSVARLAFEERVRWAYTRGPTATLEGFLQSQNAAQLTDRRAMVQFVLEEDATAVNRYLELRDQVDAAVVRADDILSGAERNHATTQITEDAARADVALTTLTMSIWNRAGRGLRDLVFPVVGTHAFGSDFGAPRMVGTADEHTHEGNDIAAPLGAQLVAVEPGMVVAMGTDRLGGIKLWLAGRSGTYYYYAHLSRFAEDVHEGDIVPAGTVVGYVGNTGNARGGIPHLHFEIHPNGGPAVDPYQYLAAADRRQRTARWPSGRAATDGEEVRGDGDEPCVAFDGPSRPKRRVAPRVVVRLDAAIAPQPRWALDAEHGRLLEPRGAHLVGQIVRRVEEGRREPARRARRVAVGAVGQVAGDDPAELLVADEAARSRPASTPAVRWRRP